MQLIRIVDVPTAPTDGEFRYSRSRAILGATILGVLAVASLLFGWLKGAWLAYYVAAIIFICLLIFQNLVTARFKASNWLIRVTDHGLFIKFRSYLNHHFSDQDVTVVFLPYSEIRSARLANERQEHAGRNDRNRREVTVRTRRFVEFELAADSKSLAKALAGERERVYAKSVVGAGRISTRYQHLPVRLASPALLRVEWGVVPSAQTLLDALTRHTLVQNSAAVSKDFVNLAKLSREEQEARLVELVESGDMMGAISIARRIYSYDLTAAKQFVETLAHKQPTPR